MHENHAKTQQLDVLSYIHQELGFILYSFWFKLVLGSTPCGAADKNGQGNDFISLFLSKVSSYPMLILLLEVYYMDKPHMWLEGLVATKYVIVPSLPGPTHATTL